MENVRFGEPRVNRDGWWEVEALPIVEREVIKDCIIES